MSFLTAEWRKLAIANYEIDPAILQPYVPFGTELDLWKGKCYVSLVGFRFINTRLLGIAIPWHTDFEEVNLRFYVKRTVDGTLKRGVVFIREIVPRTAITLVANTLYREHYETLPMLHRWEQTRGEWHIDYRWKKGGRWHSLRMEADIALHDMAPGSEEEFITEHYWGYAAVNDRRSNEYEVRHPRWQYLKVNRFDISADFGLLYGKDFNCLNQQAPASVMLMEGSAISIEGKRRIQGGGAKKIANTLLNF